MGSCARSRRLALLAILVSGVVVCAALPRGAEANGGALRLAAFGDAGVTKQTKANVDGALADGSQGYVGLGDYYYWAKPSAWATMFAPLTSKGAHLAVGNHDDPNAMRAFFPEGTQWSKNVNGVRLVALNGMRDLSAGSKDHETVKGYLCGAKESVKILLTHHNWWLGPGARHPGSEFRAGPAVMDRMVQDCGVDLVLAGHEHNYQRMMRDGIPYVIVGTGGQSIYPVSGSPSGTVASHAGYGRLVLDVAASGVTAHFKTLQGKTVDSFTAGASATQDALPPGGPPGERAASASFAPYDGNAWWVQTRVAANERVSAVCAVVQEGACKPLEPKWWGAWAASLRAPPGSMVVFRATLAGGDSVTSPAYTWPVK